MGIPYPLEAVFYRKHLRDLPNWSAYLLAITFYVATLGYEVLAPLIQILSEDSNALSIFLRAVVVILCGACLMFFPKGPKSVSQIFPLYIFLALYTLRIFENFYIRQFIWHADPVVVFGLLIGASAIPVSVLPGIIVYLPDRILMKFQIPVIGIFLFGLGLNSGSLIAQSQIGRLSIDKLNPILLGATSLFLTPSRSLLLTVARYGIIATLVGLAAFAQSRGPIVATGVAILIFGLVARGRHRRYLIRATIIVVVAGVTASVIYGFNILDIALSRFSSDAGSGLDASAQGRIAAWSASWLQFLDGALIGDRVFEPTLMHYPHNIFLESLISIGILGTFFLVLHVALCVRCSISIFYNEGSSLLSKFLGLIFIKEFIEAQFSGSIWNNNTLWVASACLLGAGIGSHRWR